MISFGNLKVHEKTLPKSSAGQNLKIGCSLIIKSRSTSPPGFETVSLIF